MRFPEDLPIVNASLNGLCTVLLLVGYTLIRQKKVAAHRAVMIAAFVVSAMFLVSYLTYHYTAGHTKFTHEGPVRTFYYVLLGSHVFLAVVTVPLVLVTLYRGLKSKFEKHRRIARWTFPIWLYVSVTGVLVYFMLYQWFPPLSAGEVLNATGDAITIP